MLAQLLRAYLRSGLRGAWRITDLAARHVPSLQMVPIEIRGYPPVYVDLRTPGMFGLFQGSPYAAPPWEVSQQALMRRLVRPGDVVFDVGANVGLLTSFLSVLVGPRGHVHTFEANSELYETLRQTVRGQRNCTLHEFGLSDADGQVLLAVPENREMASLADWTGGAVATRVCQLRALDSAVASGEVRVPDFIKCDIEGAELFMLRGARRIVDSPAAPIVLAEANAGATRALGYTSADIPRFLLDLPNAEYAVFLEESPSRWVRATEFGELNEYVLAVPASRLDRWPDLARATVITIADDGGVATA